MNSEKFNPLFASLLQKTFVGIKETKTGEEQYSLNPFIVG